MEQAFRAEAWAALQAWLKKDDRVEY
jgi:hypothetical protein